MSNVCICQGIVSARTIFLEVIRSRLHQCKNHCSFLSHYRLKTTSCSKVVGFVSNVCFCEGIVSAVLVFLK